MARHYDSFEKLKENVSETYGSIVQLLEKFDWGFFSEEGQLKVETYAILDECFDIADDLEELVWYVSDEIGKLEKEIKKYREALSLNNADEKNEVLKLLVRYIRHNLEEELWIDYEEFDHNHYKRGC